MTLMVTCSSSNSIFSNLVMEHRSHVRSNQLLDHPTLRYSIAMEASFTCEIKSTTGPPNFERFHSDGNIVDMGDKMGDKINYRTTQLARFHSFSVGSTPAPTHWI
jgi:hypothetical protein